MKRAPRPPLCKRPEVSALSALQGQVALGVDNLPSPAASAGRGGQALDVPGT